MVDRHGSRFQRRFWETGCVFDIIPLANDEDDQLKSNPKEEAFRFHTVPRVGDWISFKRYAANGIHSETYGEVTRIEHHGKHRNEEGDPEIRVFFNAG